jgi:hypothetical protein
VQELRRQGSASTARPACPSRSSSALLCLRTIAKRFAPRGQITRNLVGMVRGPEAMKPSPQLEKLVRLGVARSAVNERQAQSIV